MFMSIAITNCPQIFLQILIFIILSFPIRIYEPMIVTTNCELTTLTDRWYFCEPNKISLTIFGQLRNLLRFIEVQFITKINKHVYFLEIKKPKPGFMAQHARPGLSWRDARASTARPSRPTARDGRGPRVMAICTDTLIDSVFTANPKTLFHQSTLLQLHPPLSPSLPQRSPLAPVRTLARQRGHGRPRRRHPSLQGLAIWPMITSMTTRSG